MRALVQTGFGPTDVLKVQERPEPVAGAGQVRVKVHACGLNYAEVQARVGFYPDAPKPPAVLGYEFAGEVESLGEGAEGIEVGQRVMGGVRFGGFAELVATDVANIIALPQNFSYEQGAAVPVAYGTAYGALVLGANLQPGEKVLIHAAAGGVGIAATQLARHIGAEIFGTASAAKHDAIKAQGVVHAIDYHSEDVVQAVRKIVGDGGLDVVLDPRGGRAFKQSYGLLRAGGRLVAYGVSSILSGERRNLLKAAKLMLQMPRFSTLRLMKESKSVIGINMLRYWDEHGSLEKLVKPLTQLMDDGVINPVIAGTYPLEHAAEGHKMIQEGRNIGKVVLTVA